MGRFGRGGDAVRRRSSSSVGAYDAIPIQADPALETGGLITTSTDPLTSIQSLVFDGAAGHYLAAPGTIAGNVKFDQLAKTASPVNQTSLILLTLDVRSGQSNFPTNVDINFYRADQTLLSESVQFVCWTDVSLTQIDPDLNQTQMGRKGSFLSGPAFKSPINGILDTSGPATLLGLVETFEGSSDNNLGERLYFSNPVPTVFVPD